MELDPQEHPPFLIRKFQELARRRQAEQAKKKANEAAAASIASEVGKQKESSLKTSEVIGTVKTECTTRQSSVTTSSNEPKESVP